MTAGERRSPDQESAERLLATRGEALIQIVEHGTAATLFAAAGELRRAAAAIESAGPFVGRPVARAYATLWRELANLAACNAARQARQAAERAARAAEDARQDLEDREAAARRCEVDATSQQIAPPKRPALQLIDGGAA